jgi:hypothetical protein
MHLTGAPPCLREQSEFVSRESALSGGLPAPAPFGARGGLGEAALHLERRGGEHSRPCLPIPPKELNAKSNVDCIRMQPSIRWSAKENVDCSREAEPEISCGATCFICAPRPAAGALSRRLQRLA